MALTLATLTRRVAQAEATWGIRPYVVLACAGGADEHWQVWHPDDCKRCSLLDPVPAFVLMLDGTVLPHPDSTRDY